MMLLDVFHTVDCLFGTRASSTAFEKLKSSFSRHLICSLSPSRGLNTPHKHISTVNCEASIEDRGRCDETFSGCERTFSS